jgi:hypothetical protein
MTKLSASAQRRWLGPFTAAAAAMPVLFVYILTLYPGVVGTLDTAKFQFVGRILGTPHQPGYPLFVMVSHVFSYVPIGNLAYRMNLLSAIFGAATTGLLALVCVRLGVARGAAIALAIAAGLGRTFWSQATLAEVYSLGAAIIAGVLLCLLEWRATRRDRWIIGATAIAALGLGNHLTIVMVAPAFLLFVVVTDPRAIVRPKLIAWAIGLTIAGLAQYLFIVIRTYQGALHLEAQARTLGELVLVVRAEQFASWLGVYSWRQVLTERLPMIAGTFAAELTIAGALLLVAGFVWGLRRDRATTIMVAAGIAAIFAFVVNYRAPDIEVFLIPAFVFAWCGVAMAVSAIGAGGGWRRTATTVAVAGLAATQLWANYRVNDHSRRTWEQELINAIFGAVPDRSAIVAEGPGRDWVMDYALLGEGRGAQRDIRRIPLDVALVTALAREGRPVFAFERSRAFLAERGAVFEQVALPELFESAKLFRLTAVSACRPIGNLGWVDLSAMTGARALRLRIDNFETFTSPVDLIVAGPGVRVTAIERSGGPDDATFTSPVSNAVPADVPPDIGARVSQAGGVAAAQLVVQDVGQFLLVTIRIDGDVRELFARAVVDLKNPARALVCEDLGR